ncbi:hypothetical protein TUBRATIS_22260 [Tubulinosema ratisbonensis]|uniref:Uncharacterized protein n=1 Tax=Tubulinosema ratisbonensis TaxID=291195 RepID=A0A437AJV9_9MICR|nr:hypothetical protein TUBRATIS_22260 [Tubulinosema ratisbonensis]
MNDEFTKTDREKLKKELTKHLLNRQITTQRSNTLIQTDNMANNLISTTTGLVTETYYPTKTPSQTQNIHSDPESTSEFDSDSETHEEQIVYPSLQIVINSNEREGFLWDRNDLIDLNNTTSKNQIEIDIDQDNLTEETNSKSFIILLWTRIKNLNFKKDILNFLRDDYCLIFYFLIQIISTLLIFDPEIILNTSIKSFFILSSVLLSCVDLIFFVQNKRKLYISINILKYISISLFCFFNSNIILNYRFIYLHTYLFIILTLFNVITIFCVYIPILFRVALLALLSIFIGAGLYLCTIERYFTFLILITNTVLHNLFVYKKRPTFYYIFNVIFFHFVVYVIDYAVLTNITPFDVRYNKIF